MYTGTHVFMYEVVAIQCACGMEKLVNLHGE